jgi:MOSC domain-containing protein YiiM
MALRQPHRMTIIFSMTTISPTAVSGRVASLHLHPAEAGGPLLTVDEIEVVERKGIRGETRYFGRISRRTGKPTRRQVSLIEREQIAGHAATLGLQSIPPGAVRANIETLGINLVALVGKQIQIGDAVLFLYEPRIPCGQMDLICAGLHDLMKDNQQGVMAEVLRSGKVRTGDPIALYR